MLVVSKREVIGADHPSVRGWRTPSGPWAASSKIFVVTFETKDLVRAGTREVRPRVTHLIVPTEIVPAPVLETA